MALNYEGMPVPRRAGGTKALRLEWEDLDCYPLPSSTARSIVNGYLTKYPRRKPGMAMHWIVEESKHRRHATIDTINRCWWSGKLDMSELTFAHERGDDVSYLTGHSVYALNLFFE